MTSKSSRTPVEDVLEGVGLCARRAPLALAGARAGEEAARQRAPGDDPDALVEALRDHLALLLAVEEVEWFCIETKRVQPLRSATCWALANCHACMLLAPM